jgi:hypothetical protein
MKPHFLGEKCTARRARRGELAARTYFAATFGVIGEKVSM